MMLKVFLNFCGTGEFYCSKFYSIIMKFFLLLCTPYIVICCTSLHSRIG